MIVRGSHIHQSGAKPARLEFPKKDVEQARNQRPVVLLHGTLVGKEGIEKYREFALKHGHPVNHRDYPSITNGASIEESTEIASREVNSSRAEVARLNLEKLKKEDAREFFQLDSDLYGADDPNADKVAKLIPQVLERVTQLVNRPQEQVEADLSGQLKQFQSELAQQLEKAGVESPHLNKIAAELVDTVAPKAILIGHSAGGFVAHTMVVNPEPVLGQDDPFAYDGGNGVGEAILLSSPVGEGLPKPAPPGVLGLPYYNYDSKVLAPLEKLPQVRLARLNPFTDFAYRSTKKWLESATYLSTYMNTTLTSPLIHVLRPGYEQVEEGSEFFTTHVDDKPVPEGVSVIGVTSPHDQLSQAERSQIEPERPNAHNLTADLPVSEEDLARERPTWGHVIMTEHPDAFKQQFQQHLEDSPQALLKLLDPSNDDGVRHEALSMLSDNLQDEPGWLKAHPEVQDALKEVAAEKLPFRDSPSYLAHQLLSN